MIRKRQEVRTIMLKFLKLHVPIIKFAYQQTTLVPNEKVKV